MTSSRHLFTTARLALLAAMAVSCSQAADEPAGGRYDGAGFVTFGIGRCQHQVTNVGIGGGGHAFLWKGLALGGEIGYFRFVGRGPYGFGMATANVGYHFVDRNRRLRWDPYVDVGFPGIGFTGRFGSPAASAGGGLNYWFTPHVALRTEGRVRAMSEEAVAMFHIGLSFR